MDRIHRPLYSGPMFAIGSRSQHAMIPMRLRGTVVGVRSGRSGEVGRTRILTIKLSETQPENGKLLHADVELLVRPKL
jgi:hypothetical protein